MQHDQHPSPHDNILQFESLTLFDQDPLSQDQSLVETQHSHNKYALHHLQAEELLSQIHFRVKVQTEVKSARGNQDLLITNFRLVMHSIEQGQSIKPELMDKNEQIITPTSLPFGYMEEIDIQKKQIVIKMKTGLVYRIKPLCDLNNIYQLILFGFTHIPFFTQNVLEAEQAQNYDCLAELQRMGLNWQGFHIVRNSNGKLCSTYPKYLITSKNIQRNLLEECFKARNGNRIPILTYFSQNYQTSLWRAARPKLNQQALKINNTYLQLMSRKLFVIDLRDQQPSLRDKQLLKDVSQSLKFQKLSQLNGTFKKMMVAYARDHNILKVIGKWYQDVNHLIVCAYTAVNHLKSGTDILLQEHMGFDRAAQISALIQIILDPFFRTIHGLSMLIQKQFMSFGHPFNRRLGLQRQKLHQSSPVFVQLLECINQLIITHPNCFEYSCFYVARIAYETYTTKYNNFYFNTPHEKASSKFVKKTATIWNNLPLKKQYYNYQWQQKQAMQQLSSLRPPPSPKEYLVWRQFYDLATKMNAQQAEQTNVKQRRSSIYKVLHKKDSKEM